MYSKLKMYYRTHFFVLCKLLNSKKLITKPKRYGIVCAYLSKKKKSNS